MTWGERPNYRTKEDFITLDSVDSIILERTPEFLDYLFFHNLLDKFCFALKVHYSDRETVKRRRYRLDIIFQNYLVGNRISVDGRTPKATSEAIAQRIEFDLTKGWHDELIRSAPLFPDYLKIGVQLPGKSGPGTGGLAAWNVIQSYYSVFEFFSALAKTYSPELKIDGHKKLARNINGQVLGAASKSIIYYPFTLTSHTKFSQVPQHPKHSSFHYASYPREPGKSVVDIDYELIKAFQYISDERRAASLIDLLYEFRMWANYTGVRSILKLGDGGYLGFLMRNLGTVVFFAGGIAELAVIRLLGQVQYLAILKKFQRDYIQKNERFAGSRFLIPAYIRLRAFKHTGIITQSIDFITPELEDPVQFIDTQQVDTAR